MVGLRPDAALFSEDSAVSACLHLNVSRVVLGLGRASSRLRLAKHKLKCVSTTFCSWKPSPELQKHDFEVLGASFRPQRACPGLPGDSFSSPESLPGAPPEAPRSRPEKGGGRRRRDTRKSGFWLGAPLKNQGPPALWRPLRLCGPLPQYGRTRAFGELRPDPLRELCVCVLSSQATRRPRAPLGT